MLELLRYFPAAFLDLTWELESQLEVDRSHDGPHKVTVEANGPLAFELINNSQFPERETSSTLIMYHEFRGHHTEFCTSFGDTIRTSGDMVI